MTKSKEEINKEYQKVKSTVGDNDWNDPSFLTGYASSIEENNPELAAKLMRRVRNLRQEMYKESEEQKKHANTLDGPVPGKKNNKPNAKWSFIKKPIFLIVLLPWLVFALYQSIWASPRFESQSKVIVKQPDAMATMDTGMALLSGLGVDTTNADVKLVEAYIYSNDMLNYLNDELDIKAHFSNENADYFSRLSSDATQESFFDFYKNHVTVQIDEKAQVITILTQAFTPEFSKELNSLIVKRAEWYINEVSQKLAREQLEFIEKEHNVVEARLANVKKQLLAFQSKYQLLDPEAEGIAFQQITYSIEAKIAEKEAELKTLNEFLSGDSSQVMAVKGQLNALRSQLEKERKRLSVNGGDLSVSEVLAKFADYRVDLELALKSYASSLVSLEKSRIESYKQIKFLVIVEHSTLPQDNAYPNVSYNVSLLAVILLMLFGIGSIIYSTYRELM